MTQNKVEPLKRMDPCFSVFNLHVNGAGNRADGEFKAQFGEKRFESEINPYHKKGIMSIFENTPSIYTMSWVALVTVFVNEGRV